MDIFGSFPFFAVIYKKEKHKRIAEKMTTTTIKFLRKIIGIWKFLRSLIIFGIYKCKFLRDGLLINTWNWKNIVNNS